MQRVFFLALLMSFFFIGISTSAQISLVQAKNTAYKVANVAQNKESLLKKEFNAKGLEWPAKYVYIRSFKYDAQLEVWVKQSRKDKYKLFKTYKVCMQSGTVGPKRMQGDFQVPEGFYYINEFNPNSNYHLSLGLNYPNASDRILSDPAQPGGDIYIHGSCVSVGCIPVTDAEIEELYLITSYAKAGGQEFIPVHIFPIKYSNKASGEYFNIYCETHPELKTFSDHLERAFWQFENTHQAPIILVDRDGDYVIN